MAKSASVAPPNSLVLIEDPSTNDIPRTMAGLVAATDPCLAVGCRSAIDGETRFTLGAAPDVEPGGRAVFEGFLRTPSRTLAVRTVLGQTILDMPVPDNVTYVRVWANHVSEPDIVIIGIG